MKYENIEKKGQANKVIKSGIWYTVSNFLVKSIAFITTPIFTRLLTKAEFGLYNNYISWMAIITIFVTLNLDSTLISARYDYEDKFDEYILSVLALSTLSTSVWLLIANIFRNEISSFLGLNQVYVNVMLIYLLFLPAINLFQARERYYFEYKRTIAISLFIAIGTALISIVLVLWLPDRLFGRIIGSVVPTVLLGIVLYIYFLRKGKKIRTEYWKYAFPICLPFIPHLLSLTLLNSMDRTMITRWCNPEDTAMYSIAYTCGSMVTLLMTSMNSAYVPWLGERLNASQYDDVRKLSKIYILGFSFLAVGFMAVAPEVLLILGGRGYLEAQYVMTPIAIGCVCQFLYTMLVNVEQFKKRTVGMAIASAIAAFVNFILNYIFIPRIGYLAAAYTTLVGYLCLLGIHMVLVYKLGLNKIYDYKIMVSTVLAMMCIAVLMTLLYSNTLLRYLCLVIYSVFLTFIAIKNKNRIVQLIRRL